jgi:phenylalanyl-tRNA synthetase beta chain
MRVPLSWLADFVTWGGTPAELAERLTMAGLEVEAVEEVGRLDPGILVGRLLAVEPHPARDGLRVARVEVGAGAPVVVVSGAPNLVGGEQVAVALPGARLAGGTEVAPADLGGVTSGGVLCSEAELGLGDDGTGILVLPAAAAVGTRVGELVGVADTVLTIEVTPNRGDCLSVLGVAREVAALGRTRPRRRRLGLREAGAPAAREVRVRVEAPELCPRYCARVVRGTTLAASPLWLRLRLRRADMRPINAVVDATNYVMLERGQPLHAFDLERIGERQILVRRATSGETLVTLDGVERVLAESDLVIADARVPVALAGVMGGEGSEVTATTRTVLLESAVFDPTTIRRTARRTGLLSQAAYRFERRVDPATVVEALDAGAALIARLTGGRAAPGVVEAGRGGADTPPAVRLRLRRARAILGTGVARGEAVRRLRALGARCRGEGETLFVTAPSHRGDLALEEDLIEEIARLGGYDAIPLVLPEAPIAGGEDSAARTFARRVRRLLVAEGLSEMVTLSFTDGGTNRRLAGFVGRALSPLAVLNPLSSETGELRRSPLAGLVHALARNLGHGAPFVGAFEIGRGYGLDAQGARHEVRAVALLLHGAWPPAGPVRSGSPIDFLDVKGVTANLLAGLGIEGGRVRWGPGEELAFLHPGKAVAVAVDGTAVGAAGALHPEVTQAHDLSGEVWVAELDLERLAHYVPRRIALRPIPRFPAATRDIAVVVDEPFRAGEIVEEVRALGSPHIESVRLFDCYRGAPIPAGKKGLAYTIAYRAPDRTLTDDEVNALHTALLDRLAGRFPLALRSGSGAA